MALRSLFAFLSAAWFAYNAFEFLPVWGVQLNDGQAGGIDGEPGAVAVVWGVRAICGGLALLSLAAVDWRGAGRAYSAWRNDG